MASKSGKIGFVGGMDIPLIHRFETGYEEGARSVNPNVRVIDNYVGVTEASGVMFGKVLSISDDLMWTYYELLTDLTVDAIAKLRTYGAKSSPGVARSAPRSTTTTVLPSSIRVPM